MAQLDKDDLAQMNEDYFKSLKQERLVEVAKNLHQLATDLWEKQQQNSSNSSQPPSTDHPYSSKSHREEKKANLEIEIATEQTGNNQTEKVKAQKSQTTSSRKAGKQPGAKGFGRKQELKAEIIVTHYPNQCSACNDFLSESDSQVYMGHHVLELEAGESGFRIICQLHHYYQATCSCGHRTNARPGIGYVSVIEGRNRDLKLTEYVLVGPVLATFIASLGVRYRMSRTKIKEFLSDWVQTELSVGTIDRCIREVGIACVPVVEELVEQLQQADILHLDETHWYERGKLYWLWVAITRKTAVFQIGSRRKEELSSLVKEAFRGWLVTDGYGTRTREGSLAYSSLLSVIETCRLRKIDPWNYIAKVLALARKGINPPSFPVGN